MKFNKSFAAFAAACAVSAPLTVATSATAAAPVAASVEIQGATQSKSGYKHASKSQRVRVRARTYNGNGMTFIRCGDNRDSHTGGGWQTAYVNADRAGSVSWYVQAPLVSKRWTYAMVGPNPH